jgi:hypothetical protein
MFLGARALCTTLLVGKRHAIEKTLYTLFTALGLQLCVQLAELAPGVVNKSRLCLLGRALERFFCVELDDASAARSRELCFSILTYAGVLCRKLFCVSMQKYRHVLSIA